MKSTRRNVRIARFVYSIRQNVFGEKKKVEKNFLCCIGSHWHKLAKNVSMLNWNDRGILECIVKVGVIDILHSASLMYTRREQLAKRENINWKKNKKTVSWCGWNHPRAFYCHDWIIASIDESLLVYTTSTALRDARTRLPPLHKSVKHTRPNSSGGRE